MRTARATIEAPLLTAGGVPLIEILQISLRHGKLRALLLVLPPLLSLIFLCIVPAGNLLTRSVSSVR
jgi:hypothetical protein